MMRDDRQSAVDQILKAIEYGLLPVDEIERRLQKIISEELSCPIDAEYDEEKVELCYSLLQQIHMEKRIDIGDYVQEIKVRIAEHHCKYLLRKKALTRGLSTIVAALVIFVVLSLFNVISPVKWFSGNPSNDGEQYVVTGHEINGQAALAAISKHNDVTYYESQSLPEMESFLGFETGFPQKIGKDFEPDIYRTLVFSTWINLECSYSNEIDQKIDFNIYVFEDMNEAHFQFEQKESSGKILILSEKTVYTYTNAGIVGFLWYSDNVVYSLAYDISIINPLDITSQLLKIWH